MSWVDRLRVFGVFLIGLIYLAFEIFEDIFNISLPFDEVFGLGVAAISYLLLIYTANTKPLQAQVIAGLWIATNIFDWFGSSGWWDELVTTIVLGIVFTILFWPILKRVRFER